MKSAESSRLLERVAQVYHRSLNKSPDAVACLKNWNLHDPGLIEAFQIGACLGTLHDLLPSDGEAAEHLKSIGLLTSDGREALHGCITVPLRDASGVVRGFYGRAITPESGCDQIVPEGWKGFYAATDGICGHQQVFLTNGIMDVLSLWCAGFRGALGVIGKMSALNELQKAIPSQTNEIVLCTRGGNSDTEGLKQQLLTGRISTVRVVQWPEGVSGAFEYFQHHTAEKFNLLMRDAEQTIAEQITHTDDGFVLQVADRRYEIRSIEKPSPSRLRGTIRAKGDCGRFVLDTVDFYLSRSRRGLISEAARLFDQEVEAVEGDINRIIEVMEQTLEQRRQPAAPVSVILTDAEREEGLRLGRHQDVTGELLKDMEALGMIGEVANKLIGYLVMTSRKMNDPLALLILSGSGAGKSHLQDTILGLCPEEDTVRLTSVTDRALFYKGSDSLRNKVLALEEAAGAAKGADYALRNLISARKLAIESTVKNAATGKLETQVNIVHGPTAVFLTTTNPNTDAETRSRFIVISVDESPEQTRAILKLQREMHTLHGWRRRPGREAIIRRHHAFQRLLRPLAVVNPYEPLLSYPGDRLPVRRDQPKYLQLILVATFLRQFQRTIKHDPSIGDYVETTLEDIGLANDLAHHLFGHAMDDLSGPAQELLERIWSYARQKARQGGIERASFNRRELREAFKWGDTRLRTHLKELVQMEYLVPISGRFGQTYHYRLLGEPVLSSANRRHMPGLKSVEQLRQEADLAPTSRAGISEVSGVPNHGRTGSSDATKPDHAGCSKKPMSEEPSISCGINVTKPNSR